MPGFACRATNATAFNPMQSSVPSCRPLRPLCKNPFSGWGFDRNLRNGEDFPADGADESGSIYALWIDISDYQRNPRRIGLGDPARRSRNQIHTSVQILQKATKGTKSQGKSCDSLFPLLPFVKTPSFEPLGNRGGKDERR
jgi:hypothetical protein